METTETQAWIWTPEQLIKFENSKVKLQETRDDLEEFYTLFQKRIPSFWGQAVEIYTPLRELLEELLKLDDNIHKDMSYKETEEKFFLAGQMNTKWHNFIHQREVMASIVIANKKEEEERKEEVKNTAKIENDVNEVLADKGSMEKLMKIREEAFDHLLEILESLELDFPKDPDSIKTYKRLFLINFINDVAKLCFLKNIEEDLAKIEVEKFTLEELFIETLACLMKHSLISSILATKYKNLRFTDIYMAHLSSTLDTMIRLIVNLSHENIKTENIRKEEFRIEILNYTFEPEKKEVQENTPQ